MLWISRDHDLRRQFKSAFDKNLAGMFWLISLATANGKTASHCVPCLKKKRVEDKNIEILSKSQRYWTVHDGCEIAVQRFKERGLRTAAVWSLFWRPLISTALSSTGCLPVCLPGCLPMSPALSPTTLSDQITANERMDSGQP